MEHIRRLSDQQELNSITMDTPMKGSIQLNSSSAELQEQGRLRRTRKKPTPYGGVSAWEGY
jgi:hypothetical protein